MSEDPRTRDAVHDALAAKALAYVPYSGFAMGAAVITDKNDVIQGAIVENVSLGLAMCAERVALFRTVVQEAGKPEILAVAAPRTSGKLTWPCGACLQVAAELGGRDMIIVATDGTATESKTIAELAPYLPIKS